MNSVTFSLIGATVLLAGCYKHEITLTRSENCVAVTLGPMIVKTNTERPPLVGDELQFRRVSGSQTAFMVAVVTREFRTYSPQRFVFDLADLPRVRTASTADWERSSVVRLHRRRAGDNFRPTDGTLPGGELEYRGKKFPRAGKERTYPLTALVSPLGGSLALQSYDRKRPQRFELMPDGGWGGPPTDGNFYLEVYDSSTARKVAGVQLSFAGVAAEYLWEQTGWLTERHLVLPVTHLRLERFVICETPERR